MWFGPLSNCNFLGAIVNMLVHKKKQVAHSSGWSPYKLVQSGSQSPFKRLLLTPWLLIALTSALYRGWESTKNEHNLTFQQLLTDINGIVRNATLNNPTGTPRKAFRWLFEKCCIHNYLPAALQTCNSTMMTLIFSMRYALSQNMDECLHKVQTKQ